MAIGNVMWKILKNSISVGLIGVTVKDRYLSINRVPRTVVVAPYPTVPPKRIIMDHLYLVEKFCLRNYKFSRGDVVMCRGLHNHKKLHVQRIIALSEERFVSPRYRLFGKVPKGYCWMERGTELSIDLLLMPMGLIYGRVILPQKAMERKTEREFIDKDAFRT